MAQGVCKGGHSHVKNVFERIVVISTSAAGDIGGYVLDADAD
jgi:hypothetical protein